MPGYKYSSKTNPEITAKAVGIALPISTKHSIEICNMLRHKNVQDAKNMLDQVIAKKLVVPFRRFTGSVGHKTKIGPGRYPQKAAKEILKIIKSAEANAVQKGLNSDGLFIAHICAQKASRQWHYGRKRSRRMKRTHIEVIVEEKFKKKKQVTKKDSHKTESVKNEDKKPQQREDKK